MTINKSIFSAFLLIIISLIFMVPSNSYAQNLPGVSNTGAATEKYGNVITDNIKETGKVGVVEGLAGGVVDEYTEGTKKTLNQLGDAGSKLLDGDVLGAVGSTGKAAATAVGTTLKTGAEALKTGWDVLKSAVTGKNYTRVGNTKAVWKDPSTGAEYEIEIGSDGQIMAQSGAQKGCIPLPMKLAEQKSCLFCPLFKTIFDAANTMATQSFAELADGMSKVMIIGFAIFVAFQVLTHVGSITKQDAPKFLMGIFTQSFKVVIAFLLLRSSKEIYEYVVGPILSAGMDFGSKMLFQTGETKGGADLSACANIPNESSGGGLLPSYLFAKLDCFIRAVQMEIGYAQAIGSTLMCIGRNEATEWGVWDFGMVINGLVIYLFALLLSLAFAFFLIDATVQLGIVGALMPFLIACWPFKKTTQYTGTGFKILLNSTFIYVFMGIVVSVNIQLMGQSLSSSPGGFEEIQAAMNESNADHLKELMDIGFGGFLILICCCIFGFKFTAQASSLAGSMASGGISGNIGSKIGGMAVSGATNIAVKASAPVRQAASKGIKGAASRAWDNTKSGVSKGAKRFGGAVKNSAVGRAASQGASAVGGAVKQGANAVGGAVKQGAQATKAGISNAGNKVGGAFKSVFAQAKNLRGSKSSRVQSSNPPTDAPRETTRAAHDIRAEKPRSSTEGAVTKHTNGQVALTEDKGADTMQIVGAGKKGKDAYRGTVKNASKNQGPVKASDIDTQNMNVETNQLHGADKMEYNKIEKQVMASNGMSDKATLDPAARALLKKMADAEFLASKLNSAVGTFKNK